MYLFSLLAAQIFSRFVLCFENCQARRPDVGSWFCWPISVLLLLAVSVFFFLSCVIVSVLEI